MKTILAFLTLFTLFFNTNLLAQNATQPSVTVGQLVNVEGWTPYAEVLAVFPQSNKIHTLWVSNDLVNWRRMSDLSNEMLQAFDQGNNSILYWIATTSGQRQFFRIQRFLPTPLNFGRDLTVGSQGEDVADLQCLLIEQGYLNIYIRGYFGEATRAALASFQAAYGIGLANGYFGPITRAFINGAQW